MLDACAALISERRHLNFSMQEVADTAGVSLRTLYNHFPTREDLLDALGERADEEMRAHDPIGAETIETIADLRTAIHTNLAAFEATGAKSEATAQLPLADDSADVVLMINMLLFPAEVDRVLRPDGHVVWVNTLGDQTPIHLAPDDVAAALPGDWHGTTSFAGTGLWAVLRRMGS